MKKYFFLLLLFIISNLKAQDVQGSLKNIQPTNIYERAQKLHSIGYHQQMPDSNIYYQKLSLNRIRPRK